MEDARREELLGDPGMPFNAPSVPPTVAHKNHAPGSGDAVPYRYHRMPSVMVRRFTRGLIDETVRADEEKGPRQIHQDQDRNAAVELADNCVNGKGVRVPRPPKDRSSA